MTQERYQNPALSADDRAASLLALMTVDEKLAQLVGVWVNALLDERKQLVPDRAAESIPHGVGQFSRVGGAVMLPPAESAALTNALQRWLRENTRLGIPAIVHEESCAGYLGRGATSFPQAIGLAATWAPELAEQMTAFIRAQMRAVGAHHALAPVLDIARDARWGRVEETFGEDPFLTASIGAAYVRGLQGDDLRQGIAATGKHFVGYAMSEGGMNWAPAHIGPRELREVYLMPFAAAIREANIATIMNAYHELDGLVCGGSREIMTDLLRGELGFTGAVVSDYFTVNMLADYHHIAADKADAARQALDAGIDVELPARDCYGDPLRQALDAGRVDMALVDESARRVLRLKFQLGLFEQPYVDAGRAVEVYAAPEPAALSREIARQSVVLLKNAGGLLPLSKTLDSIAVIGAGADSKRLMQGDYHYPSHLEVMFATAEMPSEMPNPEQRAGDMVFDEHFPPTTTILAGIRAAVSPGTTVRYARGCDPADPDTSGFAEAVAAAKASQVAVVVVGDKSGLTLGATVGESIDRASLDLPGAQQALVEAIHATGVPTVVVLMTGRPYGITWIDAHVPAVLEAWFPAQEGGAALADILFGDAAPGGKLPMSFPRAVGQVPVFYGHKPSGGRSHWHGQYSDLPASPLYAFGHGLSYTQFEYSGLEIGPAQARAGEAVMVRFTLRNTGARPGDEVAQLYLHDVVGSLTRPVQALKGFRRVRLQPGESRVVTFRLDTRHLAFYDRAMRCVVEPGEIRVMVGSSSADIRLRGKFEIIGETTPVEPVFFTPVDVS